MKINPRRATVPNAPAGPWQFIATLLAVAALVWAWSATFAFTWWDDDLNVFQNEFVATPGHDHLQHLWLHAVEGLYVPVAYTFWAITAWFAQLPTPDAQGIRVDAMPFHLLNIVVHTLSAIVLFLVLRLLVRSNAGALAGAILFLIHPLQIESVAWVTGFKEASCGMFGLLSLWQYLLASTAGDPTFPAARFDDTRVHHVLAILALLAALLCNPLAAAVAPMAAAIDWLLVGRPLRSVARSIGLLIVPILVVAIISARVQSVSSVEKVAWWLRPMVALDALSFYIGKLLLPVGLCVDYERTPRAIVERGYIWWTWTVPVVAGIAAWRFSRGRAWLVAGAAVFAAGFLPVLGFKSFTFQQFSTVADRYAYLALVGPALIVAGWVASNAASKAKLAFVGVVGVLLAACTVWHMSIWRDNNSLWRGSYATRPNSPVVLNNLGDALKRSGDLDGAIHIFQRSVQLHPEFLPARDSLATALLARGRFDEALQQMGKCLELQDALAAHADARLEELRRSRVESRVAMGMLLVRKKRLDDARVYFRQALQLDPENTGAAAGLRLTSPGTSDRGA